jgi:hypothetical protein
MWICLNKAFLSVVQNRDVPNTLLVRARVAGHIQQVFPEAKVFTDSKADYLYRAFIGRKAVAQAVAATVENIDYDNFKDSVDDDRLHVAYMNVWGVMEKLQA